MKKSPPHIYRFLSGQQVLELKELTSRQALESKYGISPSERPGLGRENEDDGNNDDDALLYIFVSHRWEEPGNPDASKSQLKALQGLLRMVEQLFCWVVAKQTSSSSKQSQDKTYVLHDWPLQRNEMIEGQPQAASLVARIWSRRSSSSSSSNPTTMTPSQLQNPLQHIYLWYDCACLPQNFPRPKTRLEKQEMSQALTHLDWLVRQCPAVVCLRTPDDQYHHRAWCSFEHLNIALQDLGSDISLDCHKFLHRQRVDWRLNDTDTATNTIKNNNTATPLSLDSQITHEMKEMQTFWFQNLQHRWERVLDDSCREVPMDFCRKQYQLSRHCGVQALPPAPLLQQALEHMARELFAAVFGISCRDAALWAKASHIPAATPAAKRMADDNDKKPTTRVCCIPQVGIQCGLHDDTIFHDNDHFQRAIRQCYDGLRFESIDDSEVQTLKCREGHGLDPQIARFPQSCRNMFAHKKSGTGSKINIGNIYVSCEKCGYDMCFECAVQSSPLLSGHDGTDPSSQAALDSMMEACGFRFPLDTKSFTQSDPSNQQLCERRIVIDLYELSTSYLARFAQRCTNSGDVAFVGLLSLRNFLSSARQEFKATSGLKLHADVLVYLEPLAIATVEKMAIDLAHYGRLSPLQATITIKVPRWVLLDMANNPTQLNVSILQEDQFKVSIRAQEYLHRHHPEAFSFSFDSEETSIPLNEELCLLENSENTNKVASLSMSVQSDGKPTPLSRRACPFNENCASCWSPCEDTVGRRIQFVSEGLFDSWCLSEMPLPLMSLGCAFDDSSIVITGGASNPKMPELASTLVACPTSQKDGTLEWGYGPDMTQPRWNHATCKISMVDGEKQIVVSGGSENGKKLASSEILDFGVGWIPGPTLRHARALHHMIGLNGCLFVFGGQTDDPSHCKDFDIFNFNLKKWHAGPRLPKVILGCHNMVLIRERFVVLVGGIIEGAPSTESWVLDLGPWLQWCAAGFQANQRPTSTWFKGFNLVAETHGSPDICFASASQTGRPEDWIFAMGTEITSTDRMSNVCNGIRLDPAHLSGDPAYWSSLCWQKIGSPPELTTTGRLAVMNGQLFRLGGISWLSSNDVSCGVQSCRFSLREMLPLCDSPCSNESPGIFLGNNLVLYQMALNNCYLLGRLGLPYLGQDGKRILWVFPPGVSDVDIDNTPKFLARHCD